jgi:hypothetical protein
VLFPDLFDRPLLATFDQAHASSDGGAVLLAAAERRYRLIDGFAQCLVDDRQAGKIHHTVRDLLAQRIFGLACGYPDANDADRLADDPIQKLLLGRDPVAGDALASQPTISRFENAAASQALYEMGQTLATSVVDRHQRRLHGRARRITIDLDPTDDPTHGAQQLTFFNGHYDSWCYLPLLAFVTFDTEVEQYLCAAVLRPGNAPATRGALGVLRRLLALLRIGFPRARYLVRLDGGYATPAVLKALDAEPGLDYVVAMAQNAVLARRAAAAMAEARALSEASGQTEHVYLETEYAARTWPYARRVVIKAEVVRLPGRTSGGRRASSTSRSTARAGISKTGSRNSTTGCTSGAPAAAASGPISCACSSRRRRTCSCKNFDSGRPARSAPAPKCPPSANGYSSWASKSSAPCDASCSICRPQRPISTPGVTSPSRSGRAPANSHLTPHQGLTPETLTGGAVCEFTHAQSMPPRPGLRSLGLVATCFKLPPLRYDHHRKDGHQLLHE